MSIPHKCPCCDGRGERPLPGEVAIDTMPVSCRACNGTGIVWEMRAHDPQGPWPPRYRQWQSSTTATPLPDHEPSTAWVQEAI